MIGKYTVGGIISVLNKKENSFHKSYPHIDLYNSKWSGAAIN